MELYLNELSLKQTSDNTEAKQWLSSLIKLSSFVFKILDSLNQPLTLRTTDEFQVFKINHTQTLIEFLQTSFGGLDPETIIFLKILDSPHITEKDPLRENYDYHSIKLVENEEKSMSGLGATYIKNTMAVSFDSDEIWDNCHLEFEIAFLTNEGEIHKEDAQIKHASKKEHIIRCHLDSFAKLYDWENYTPYFDADRQQQNILPLLSIYSFQLGEDDDVWNEFYSNISHLSETERIAKIKEVAQTIAQIQGWEAAIGSVKNQNIHRTLYTIPNSDFIISIDTQHGDFEVLKNHNSPNHYGSVSFDGKRFKSAQDNHSINI